MKHATLPESIQITLSPKQTEALQALTNPQITSVGYGGAAGGRKSYLGVVWLGMMADCYPGTRWFIARKSLKNLRRTTLATFWQFWDKTGQSRDAVTYKDRDGVLQFRNGSEILLLDVDSQPSDPNFSRFGGLELTGGFVDESHEVSEAAIDILTTRIDRWQNERYGLTPKILETFNPDKGHVYRRFFKPYTNKKLPDYRVFIRARAYDNPYLSKTYLTQLNRADKVTRDRLLLGNFDYDRSPACLFDASAVAESFASVRSDVGTSYMSVDIAGTGRDRTVMMAFRGNRLLETQVYAQNDATELLENIKTMAMRNRVRPENIILDADGLGFVSTSVRGAFYFHANGKVLKRKGKTDKKNKLNYKNLKAQCFFVLAEYLNEGKLDLRSLPAEYRDSLAEELLAIKRNMDDPDAPITVQPKKDLRKEIGRSPDIADCLMMSMISKLEQPTPIFKPLSAFGFY